MRNSTPLLALALLASACNYSPPLRAKGDRWRKDEILNSVTGAVHLTGPAEPANTMVLLFDAFAPGPPEGTSGPVDFAVITADEFVGDSVFGYRGEYAFTDVPDGEYLVDAIVDVDGDFGPLAFTLGGATCGDWQGSHFGLNEPAVTTTVDTGGPSPAVYGKGRVIVEGGRVVRGVAVDVAQELTTERPAFVFDGDLGYQAISLTAAGTQPVPPSYKLKSSGIHVVFPESPDYKLDLANPCAPGADPRFCSDTTLCEGAFSVFYADKDGDGFMDPHPDYPPDFGLKDIWPRVFLEYLGTPTLVDGVPQVDENGFPLITPPTDLAPGEFWGGENFPFALEATFNLAIAPVGVPTKMPEISVLFPPLVAKFDAEGNATLYDLSIEADRAAVPRGIWGVNIISWTGQTWGLPNEISEWGLESTDPAFLSKTQGGFLLTTD